MKLLALDPSSTATGYALFLGDKLLSCGKAHGKAKDEPVLRCQAMVAKVQGICLDHAPLEVVVEMPGGKVHARIKGYAPSGLDVYGMAAGMIYEGVNKLEGVTALHHVTPNEWTGGNGKEERARYYGIMFRGVYDPAADKGLDVADAIGIGLYFRRETARRRLIANAQPV